MKWCARFSIAIILVGNRGFSVSRQVAHDTHPADRRAGVDHRHLRGSAADRLFRQHRLAAGSGAGDRHRRRRRHRGRREHRAGDRGRTGAVDPGRLQEGNVRDHRSDPRHYLRSVVGVCAGRLHPRHQRPIVPPVRRRRLGFDADLGAQCADPEPGAVLGPAQARPDGAGGPMRYVLGAIDRARDGYVAVVRRLARVAIVGVVVAIGALAAAAFVFNKTPQSFLPDEDQGAIFAALRLPEGASINRTAGGGRTGRETSCERFPACRASCRWSDSTSSITSRPPTRRSSSSGSSPTKSASTRRKAPTRSSRACGRRLAAIQGAIVFPFNLPPILGLGNTGGFQYVLEALQGQSPTDVAAVMNGTTGRRPISSPSSPACSAPTPPTRRRSISISIATRPQCSASRSATYSTRCNRPWAAFMSTTSTFSAALGRSMCRPTRSFRNRD